MNVSDRGMTQAPEMQAVCDRGLEALSVQEMGQLLSHLGLDCFVANFQENDVSALLRFYVVS